MSVRITVSTWVDGSGEQMSVRNQWKRIKGLAQVGRSLQRNFGSRSRVVSQGTRRRRSCLELQTLAAASPSFRSLEVRHGKDVLVR